MDEARSRPEQRRREREQKERERERDIRERYRERDRKRESAMNIACHKGLTYDKSSFLGLWRGMHEFGNEVNHLATLLISNASLLHRCSVTMSRRARHESLRSRASWFIRKKVRMTGPAEVRTGRGPAVR